MRNAKVWKLAFILPFITFFIISDIVYCNVEEGENYYDEPSTYIEPYFPPSGAYSFASSTYWSARDALFASIAVVVGVFICFFGYRNISTTFYILSFISSFIVIYVYSEYFIGAYIEWWLIAIAVIPICLFITWLVSCVPLLSIFGIGFISGFVFVCVFWTGCVAQFLTTYDLWFIVIQWCLVVIIGVILGILSLTYQRISMIAGTSIIGSFLTAVGCDYFMQDNFSVVIVNVFRGQQTIFDPLWFAITSILFWIVLCIICVPVQWYLTADNYDHRKRAEHTLDVEKDMYVKFINY